MKTHHCLEFVKIPKILPKLEGPGVPTLLVYRGLCVDTPGPSFFLKFQLDYIVSRKNKDADL